MKHIEINTKYLKTTREMISILNSHTIDEETTIDLSKSFIRPYALLLLIFTIKNTIGEHKQISFIPSKKNYLYQINAYDYFQGKYYYSDLSTTHGFGSKITSIHITQFLMENNYINYAEIESISNIFVEMHDQKFLKNINYINFFIYMFRELFRNFVEHSYGSTITIYSHILPRVNLFEIAFFDNGKGLTYSLSKNEKLKRLLDNGAKPIDLALEPGISSKSNVNKLLPEFKDWENSGYGLSVIKEICLALRGEFIISSGKEGKIFDYYNNTIEDFQCNIKGVGIQVRFRFDRNFDFDNIKNMTINNLEKKTNTMSSKKTKE